MHLFLILEYLNFLQIDQIY